MEVQLNCRHAVNTRDNNFRSGPTPVQLWLRSSKAFLGKWQHWRTLVIFLAAKDSQAAAGGKSLANSLVVPRSF